MAVRTTTQVDIPFGEFTCFEGDRITGQVRPLVRAVGPQLAMLLSFVEPGDVVIDVGAHIGTSAVPLGRAARPAGTHPAAEQDS